MIYAHSLKNEPEENWQTLDAHHAGVAKLARDFAIAFAPATAGLIGSIHDTGKRSDAFQKRLHGGQKVDHTSAAFLLLASQWGKKMERIACLLAHPLLGHHGGLLDTGNPSEAKSLLGRLSVEKLSRIPDWKAENVSPIPPADNIVKELDRLMFKNGHCDVFAVAFCLRMLHSALVDADWLDTERFCSPERYTARKKPVGMARLEERLFSYLDTKGFLQEAKPGDLDILVAGAKAIPGSPERINAIRLARASMLRACIAAAGKKPGMFSLTMPTGGGKTLSSLAFALRHAREHGLSRIIYVIPYTSIIEQTAGVFREALGMENVLEHHGNIVFDDTVDNMTRRLATENWDADVIVTTQVQFFESLFANSTSRTRKLHNMAKSVIILDEAQTLPVPFVEPCMAALRELACNYGSSVVLCTATQPALAVEETREIVAIEDQEAVSAIFSRATVEVCKQKLDDDELVQAVKKEKQALCILNSRKHAKELYRLLPEEEANFHLSAYMTPAHRSHVLDAIRKRLACGLPCRVVSTSLVECGVDISFPVVFREKNGLDTLAQATGRCNREGKGASGRVICFTSTHATPKKASELNRRRNAFDQVSQTDDIFSSKNIRSYFERLYSGSNLDEENILGMTSFIRGKYTFKLEFAKIAKSFRLVGAETTGIVIENKPAQKILSSLAPHETPSSDVMRRLGQYSVQVYKSEFNRLLAAGRIEIRNEIVPVLAGSIGYDPKTGLDVEMSEGIPVSNLIF